jgi:aerobic carbon-monoxide dehydrogenase large subunit
VSIMGSRVVRTEDPRLLTVGGASADDLKVPELTGAARVWAAISEARGRQGGP